jgi:REP element-mobilizing transposase RayT
MPKSPALSNASHRLPARRLLADGATHFLTWRLADQQPRLVPAERDLVANALRHFDGDRYDLHAWVVMDDHVHVVVSPLAEATMAEVLSSWRRFTARLLCAGGRRRVPLWQRGFYARVIWSAAEYGEKVSYVLGNPWKRWPQLTEYRWVSSAGGSEPDARDARPHPYWR